MLIPSSQLPAHLAKGIRSLYTLMGDEPLLQQETQDALRDRARQEGYTERQVLTVSGAHFDWSAALVAGQSLSLFAERQMVEIRIPTGKPGKDGGAALQQLAQAATGQQDVLTVVVLPRLDAAATKSAWFAALDQHGVVIRLDSVERPQLPAWIAHRLQAQGQRVATGEAGQRTLAFMADRVEGNLLAAHQEIQKLGLLYPPGELDFAQVESAVLNVARYDPFKWVEAILDGRPDRVLRMLDGLQAEGTAAVLVHWALAEEIRALWRVKSATAVGKPLPLALREQRVWGPREKRFERALPGLGLAELQTWLGHAHLVDGIVKGLRQRDWPQDPWQALLALALPVCRACAAQRPNSRPKLGATPAQR
jgi:DNA polymerase-3 subunit delta